jgi:hypothetical protein
MSRQPNASRIMADGVRVRIRDANGPESVCGDRHVTPWDISEFGPRRCQCPPQNLDHAEPIHTLRHVGA